MRRLPVLAKVGCLAHLGALICLAVAFERRDSGVFEGAYFNRSVGEPATAGVFIGGQTAPWLIAAAVLLIIGTALFVRAAWSSDR